MKSLNSKRALVLLSGGQDSTTCLYWALKHYDEIEALTIDYGQRHRIEIKCAEKIAADAETPWKLLPLNLLKELGGNSLTDENQQVCNEKGDDKLPLTFVPGRNLLFLNAAAALAYQKDCGVVVTGVCQTDYSGYPDCRQDTMQSLEKTLQLGMECDIKIVTPLMRLTKAESVHLAQEVGGLEALKFSHTCYKGQQPPCSTCDACILRAKGFQEAGIPDPLLSSP